MPKTKASFLKSLVNFWSGWVHERQFVRSLINRIVARHALFATGALMDWLRVDGELRRQQVQVGKFAARFRSLAAFTAFSSWCGAHREWMSIKGRMASVARKMANRDTLAGYNTWFKGVATRKRQQHLVKKFGLRMRLGTCSCFR
jgi:hypothetical protein